MGDVEFYDGEDVKGSINFDVALRPMPKTYHKLPDSDKWLEGPLPRSVEVDVSAITKAFKVIIGTDDEPAEPPDYGVEIVDGKITVDLSKDGVEEKKLETVDLSHIKTDFMSTPLSQCVDAAKQTMAVLNARWDGHPQIIGHQTEVLTDALKEYINAYEVK